MKNYILLFLNLTIFMYCNAQMLISDNPSDTNPPNSNSALELRSLANNKGLLLPKVALTARNNPYPMTSHIAGMMIYNTATTGAGDSFVSPGLYYNNGIEWLRISASTPIIGDLKYGIEPTDHSGWYLLNGRAVNSLSSAAQANAINLGFSTNIPNAENRYIKAKNPSESMGQTVGSSSIILTQNNLPNVTFSGTTSTSGNHAHTYNDRADGVSQSAEVNDRTTVDNTNGSRTTSIAGSHFHTFSFNTGGSSTPITYLPSFMTVNIFVYLGP